MSKEKQDLLLLAPPAPRTSQRTFNLKSLFLFLLLSAITLRCVPLNLAARYDHETTFASSCPQVDALVPQRGADVLANISDLLATSTFKTKAVSWLAGAVQIPTEVFDGMPAVEEDERWEVFAPFHDYLSDAFPLVHTMLDLTKVNTYGLLYEWKGSDKSLKPILLAAHQDVVPVEPETEDQWTHPPFSGHYDGEYIWGRGSSDDKSGLIGIMIAIETLLEQGFAPTRTVVLAYGFDEEASGLQGASALGAAMRDRYGEDDDPFAFIVDEGGGFTDRYGTVFATPGVAEKGYLDVHLEVTSPGGHSSVPPAHTTIGMLSRIVVEYEDNPYKVELSRDSIPYALVQCHAAHGATMPKKLKHLVRRSRRSNEALNKLRDVLIEDNQFKSLISTTQAVDIVHGGVKSNALPEQAYALVNHRIATTSSVHETMVHDTALLAKLAAQYNLSYTAFGDTLLRGGSRTLTLKDAYGRSLEPAPVSPIAGKGSEAYQLLSGTIKATHAAHRGLDLASKAGQITVVPGMKTGNTDTRYYWDLSRNIFRYNHKNTIGSGERLPGVHTVNEAVSADSLLEMIRFFTTLILNADESRHI
ncbi:Gly-X carboxypeptidase [Mycena sanguinolenta]|uniref:Gly-X carboxypeptidase n=1 Tax=Mycena sanguinolenta TaxID=230812 RepID=A0A8H6Z4F4_9AGAR|nr:Gly-X carboxypeptidase [Mycena sanguinolenta]